LLFKILDENKKENPDENIVIAKNLKTKVGKLELEKTNLTKLSCRGLIDDDEFVKQRNDYEKEISILKQKLISVKNQANKNDELVKKVKFAVQARENFNNGGIKTKKNILSGLGTNQELNNRKLHILAHKWMIPIKNDIKPIEAKFYTLELNKLPLTKAKSELLNSLRCELPGSLGRFGNAS